MQTTGQVNASSKHSVFYLFLEETIFPVRAKDARKMIADLAATCWRLRECIQAREFAVTHRLE